VHKTLSDHVVHTARTHCPTVLQDLVVQCESQVLQFVLRYLASTQLDPEAAAAIGAEVSENGR